MIFKECAAYNGGSGNGNSDDNDNHDGSSGGKSLRSTFQGWLCLRSLLPSEGMQAFAEQVSNFTPSNFGITADLVDIPHSVALYNAIWLYARAATKVLSEGGDLTDGKAVTAAVRNTTFEGAGNLAVDLNKNGDRVESYEVGEINH